MEHHPTALPEALIISTDTQQHEDHCGSDDDSDKVASNTLNKNVLRCLLLLLPVAIPVVVYLKDIDATRRIFLAAFVLFLIIIFSCMLMALLRTRSRRHLAGSSSNSEIARELAQRHIMSVTHRLLPRTRCQILHGEVTFSNHRPILRTTGPGGPVPIHYHLASTYSRSPSPRRLRPPSPARSECGRLILSPAYSPQHLGLFRSISQPSVDLQYCGGEARVVRDDPPSYEEALNYPLAHTQLCKEDVPEILSETPPPTYDRVVK